MLKITELYRRLWAVAISVIIVVDKLQVAKRQKPVCGQQRHGLASKPPPTTFVAPPHVQQVII